MTLIPATDTITAVVSPRSVGGTSLFEASESEILREPESFRSEARDLRDAARELQQLGFTIHEMGEATFTISGDKKLFQDVLGKKLRKEKTKLGPDLETEFFTSAEDGAVLSAPGDLSRIIEGIALTRPPEFFAGPSPIPPLAPIHQNAYRYLFVPDEVAVLLRATRTHRTGGTGMGIKVAMCDTGFYRHPFYSEHGYRVLATQLAAGAVNSATDDVGHGTGEAANIFALAPDVQLIPIKMGDPIDAIKKARNSGAKVITNSWGYSVDVGAITWATLDPYLKALAQEIQLAINAGVTVCFAAGNGHYAFPASMPSVVAVGGVHVNYPGLDFEASSYASSFASKIFPGRAVPDVCGLTGKKVNINGGKAPSLMLPVQPSCQLDGIDPSTGANSEGWGLFSGTSAACPQVAGVCALMLEKNAGLTPAQVKTNLMKSARDVKAGQTAMGTPAGAGPDLATGAGLVDAKWAYLISMGSMAARFLEATREEKALLLQSGQVPDLPADFVDDLIETLRSR